MSTTDQARRELVSALNLLMRRRGATRDAAELEQIEAAIDTINAQLQEIDQASLLEAAASVASAAEALEAVVAGAHTGAFEAFVAQARAQIERLRAIGTGAAGPRRAAGARPVRARPAAVTKPAAKPIASRKRAAGKPAVKKPPARKPAPRKKPAAATRKRRPTRGKRR